MRWTAVVPLKPGLESKSRLATILSPEERCRLVETMARQVIAALDSVEAVGEIVMIGSLAGQDLLFRQVPDHGRGLNGELNAMAATISGGLLIIHADLPWVRTGDIAALLTAAENSGCAIAPDRHGEGTNALALREVPESFAFAFGEGSFAAHRASLGTRLTIVERDGLACDVDSPADLKLAVARGLRCAASASETV
jgi:2-phospho-L-lactate/phosphoenolpyruvate guanylyltransferase